MKILILRFSSIGDIILTTPVVRCIKTQYPDHEIHFLTKKEYGSILVDNPFIDHLHLLDNNLSDLSIQFKREKFDLVIDLHKNLRTRILKSKLGCKSVAFDKINLQKWLMVNLKINKMPNIHIVERYLKTVESIGVKPDQLGLDFFIPEKDEVPLNWLPKPHQEGYVAVSIGGQHHTKKLPANRLIELCDKINKPVVLLGGKEDAPVAEEISAFFNRDNLSSTDKENFKKLNKKTLIFNGCGKFNLNQSASLIRQSKCLFTHDTGLMHIGAALKKEIFSIWGNTIPEFGMYPYKTKFTIFENKELGCRPCSKIGYNKCPKGHFKCMNEVKFDFYIP